MKLKNTAFAYNVTVQGSSNCDWGTDLGQGKKHTYTLEGFPEILNAMVYYKIEDVEEIKVILGKGTRTPKPFAEYEDQLILASCFKKVYVNGVLLEGQQFIMYILKEVAELNSKGEKNVHCGRCTLKFSNSLLYKDVPVNQNCIDAISESFGLSKNGSWAILDMRIQNEDELHLYGFAISDTPKDYNTKDERNKAFENFIQDDSKEYRRSAFRSYLFAPGTFQRQSTARNYWQHISDSKYKSRIRFVWEHLSNILNKQTEDLLDVDSIEIAKQLKTIVLGDPKNEYANMLASAIIGKYIKFLEKSNLQIAQQKKSETDDDVKLEYIPRVIATDPTEFVWACVKYFNTSKELQKVFESKWKQKGGTFANYIMINACYVAKELETTEVEDCAYDKIKIYDDSYISNNFYVTNVENFDEAIEDVFKGKYQVEIIKKEDETQYILSELYIAKDEYIPYLTALCTKPFMLLAGISGTGKSRIARQIAKACWPMGHKQREAQVPSNFCMIQVKPNWHDSTELLGYVSRVNGERYVCGDFLPFVAKAWENLDIPHVLCLDEMNLAPVEQYFAEYLSVIESRKVDEETITTDPIIKACKEGWYDDLIDKLFTDTELRIYFKEIGITLPPNLFVIGTVNMDETTFSFSRKVLDRAMTIEMNKVELDGGLGKESDKEDFGVIDDRLIGKAVEGKDVYSKYQDDCDKVIDYLKEVNEKLEGTPFKIAYRTRNEFLLYAVNRRAFDAESSLDIALDEMTSMKILPRIEGDSERVKQPLEALHKLMTDKGWTKEKSISIKKIDEMLLKLGQGYTSYWT